MIPETEFRTLPVQSPKPADRTSEGTVVGAGSSLDLGTVDTTDEAQVLPARVVWWRVKDMKGNSEISNIRVWLEGADLFIGTVAFYMDITDSWTSGKLPMDIQTGSPGTAPTAEGASNITRIGGGVITGVTHDQTTQYIFLSGTIGVNEPTGVKTSLTLNMMYDYH